MIHKDLSSEKLPWRGNFPQNSFGDCFVGSSPSMAASQKVPIKMTCINLHLN